MLENKTDQVQDADTPTQETKTFIRHVRTKTRRKYAPEDKIHIVLEGFRREVTVNGLCRREGHNVLNPKRSNILPARNIPSGNMLELRDPTWSMGMPELSVDEIVQQA